jgi:hypothetical protein
MANEKGQRVSEQQQQSDAARMDDDVAAILRDAEAGIGTLMRVTEAAEERYFGAVAATTVQPSITTTSST